MKASKRDTLQCGQVYERSERISHLRRQRPHLSQSDENTAENLELRLTVMWKRKHASVNLFRGMLYTDYN